MTVAMVTVSGGRWPGDCGGCGGQGVFLWPDYGFHGGCDPGAWPKHQCPRLPWWSILHSLQVCINRGTSRFVTFHVRSDTCGIMVLNGNISALHWYQCHPCRPVSEVMGGWSDPTQEFVFREIRVYYFHNFFLSNRLFIFMVAQWHFALLLCILWSVLCVKIMVQTLADIISWQL